MAQVLSAQVHVRFHPDCVLIPDSPVRTARPHFEARSLSLPLSWARKPNEADLNDPTFTPNRPTKLMVKIPSFTRRARVHSPEREITPRRGCLHSPGSPPRAVPFALPALVESTAEDSSSSSTSPISSSPPSSLPVNSPTVPLRPCCQACMSKIRLALDDNYTPKWSPGARRKKERDEKESLACSHAAHMASIDAMLSEHYQPFGFGKAMVDEVEVARGKGATTKMDEEGEGSGSDEEAASPPAKELPNPFAAPAPHVKKCKPVVMSPSAEDRAFADMLPPALATSPRSPPPTPMSPPTASPSSTHLRRQSLSERSSSMLHACLRGSTAVLKSVASAEGNVSIKLL